LAASILFLPQNTRPPIRAALNVHTASGLGCSKV